MAEGPIDFWFTMGSTYSYLSVMRLADVERSTGVSFRWRPFHLLLILQEMKHVPFADKPAKCALYVARHRTARGDVRPCRQVSGALSGQTIGDGQSCRHRRHARRMGRRLRARRLSALVSGRARRPAASPICPQACAISGKIRAAFSRSRIQPKATIACWPKPTPPEQLGIFGSPTFAVGARNVLGRRSSRRRDQLVSPRRK